MNTTNYDDLTFHDDFMFCTVLQNNPDLTKELLELILGKQIGELVTVNQQHPIKITPDRRGVRFDVYAKDDNSIIYDIEMQNGHREELPKRSRYTQSLADLEMLKNRSKFTELKESYVIFICTFNMMPDEGMHKYSFRNICVENRQLELGDRTEKIFLCTEGTEDDVSRDMAEFLAYVAGAKPDGDFTKRLENAVESVRQDPQSRKDYMDFQDYLDDAKAEGIRIGEERGRKAGLEEGRQEERLNTEREKKRAEAAEKGKEAAEAKLAEAMKRIAELEQQEKSRI